MIRFAAAVMLLTSLPYALRYAAQGKNLRFTGFVLGVEDGNLYITKMLSGAAVAWSFRTPYTTIPQVGAPLFLPYLLLGELAVPPGLHEQLVAIPGEAYSPFNLQRRLVEGIWVAFVCLSLAGIDRRLADAGWGEGPKNAWRWDRRLYLLAAVLALPSSGNLLAGGLQVASNPQVPAFRPADEVDLFEFLGRQDPAGAAVLAPYETGNALPAWAPAHVVIGHGPESAGLEVFSPRVEAFLPRIRRMTIDRACCEKQVRITCSGDPPNASWAPGTPRTPPIWKKFTSRGLPAFPGDRARG